MELTTYLEELLRRWESLSDRWEKKMSYNVII